MRPTRGKSLIYDIYGAYVRRLGGWIAVADLILLLGQLDVDEHTVRSSVSRLSRSGMLVPRRRAGRAGYELSARAEAMLAEGDEAIYGGIQPAELAEGWILVSFSVPEGERGRRHQLRSRLSWLGYGNLGGGLWIAPRRTLERTLQTVRRLGLEPNVDVFEARYHAFRTVADLVARCWDLETLGARYESFVRAARPLMQRLNQRREPVGGDVGAFVDYTILLHEWRKLPFLDPGLPVEVLPANWQGSEARALFDEVSRELDEPALRYVKSVLYDGPNRS